MRSVSRLMALLACLLLLAACNLDIANNTPPTATPDLPRVEILAPANNSRVIEDIEFDFDILARDETAGIAKVELLIDDEPINEASPPDSASVPTFRVSMNWKARGIGQHFVEVIAYRPDGTRGDSAKLTLEVVASN